MDLFCLCSKLFSALNHNMCCIQFIQYLFILLQFIQPFSVLILYPLSCSSCSYSIQFHPTLFRLYPLSSSLYYPSLSFILFFVLSVLILYPLLCSIRPNHVSSSLFILNSPHAPSSFIQPFSGCILYQISKCDTCFYIHFSRAFKKYRF